MVQSGTFRERLPKLSYVVVSATNGAVGSISENIAKIKVCGGQRSQWCSLEHCGAAKIKGCCGQGSQWYSREHCGADCQDYGM